MKAVSTRTAEIRTARRDGARAERESIEAFLRRKERQAETSAEIRPSVLLGAAANDIAAGRHLAETGFPLADDQEPKR